VPDPEEALLGRLRWRCRRGMKELDLVLVRWLEHRYAGSPPHLRSAFERLLEAQDPELVSWLFRRDRPADPDLAAIVDEVLDRTG